MPPTKESGTMHEQVKAMRIRQAKELATAALKNPYGVGGRGSILESVLARTVLDLLEERPE
jgi:hypothetical protein